MNEYCYSVCENMYPSVKYIFLLLDICLILPHFRKRKIPYGKTVAIQFNDEEDLNLTMLSFVTSKKKLLLWLLHCLQLTALLATTLMEKQMKNFRRLINRKMRFNRTILGCLFYQ